MPVCRPWNNRFALPPVKTAADLAPAWQSVFKEVGLGNLCPQDAESIATMLETRRRAFETVELDGRVRGLEAKMARDNDQDKHEVAGPGRPEDRVEPAQEN